MHGFRAGPTREKVHGFPLSWGIGVKGTKPECYGSQTCTAMKEPSFRRDSGRDGVYGGEIDLVLLDGNCDKISPNQDFWTNFFLFSCIFQGASAATKIQTLHQYFKTA